MRSSISCLLATALLAFTSLVTLRAADALAPRAIPLDEHVGTPAMLDLVTFEFHSDGQDRKVIVTTSPILQRFDEPDDRYSVIYNPATQFYIGLEHGNFTYWTFSWPEVQTAVESSKRGEKRLQDLAIEGINSDNPSPETNAAPVVTPDTSSLATGDDSGYVWKQTADKRRIAGLDCVRWTGESVSGEDCIVWCYPGPLPRLTEALARLHEVEEPMALVPVRTVAPDFIFPVYAALTKAGITPVQINWGTGAEKGMFRLAEQKTRPYDAKLFAPPRLYMKTTLVTMDGMIPEQPSPDLRGNAKPPPIDHLTPNRAPVAGQQ